MQTYGTYATEKEASDVALWLCIDFGLRAASRQLADGAWSVVVSGCEDIWYPNDVAATAGAIAKSRKFKPPAEPLSQVTD